MPLFVKPLRMDASIGIDRKALVSDTGATHEAGDGHSRRMRRFGAGRKNTSKGVSSTSGFWATSNRRRCLRSSSDFSGLPEGAARVLDTKAKWEKQSAEYKGTKSVIAEIPDELKARLQKVSLDAYRGLRVRDYGRVDLRLTDTGEIYVIEVNRAAISSNRANSRWLPPRRESNFPT